MLLQWRIKMLNGKIDGQQERCPIGPNGDLRLPDASGGGTDRARRLPDLWNGS